MENKKPDILDALKKICKEEDDYEICFVSLEKIFKHIAKHEIEEKNNRAVSIKKIIDGIWKETEENEIS